MSIQLLNNIYIKIKELRRQLVFEEGIIKGGTIDWLEGDDQIEARVQFESSIQDEENANLRLTYCINHTDHQDYDIRLSRTPMHFGGYRYWFHCPETDKRVTTLYLELKDGRFLSRHAIGALYPSQRETDFDRALAMRRKYADKLRGAALVKPKGMHISTYQKLLDKYNRYHHKALKIMAERMDRYHLKFS